MERPRAAAQLGLLHPARARGRARDRCTSACPGLHNARNGAIAAVAALQAGAPFAAAQAALARFAGVTRRFEFRGEANGVTFVDDYAHLPTEVRAALATARTGGWSRVVAVFQPHRFSRTAALADRVRHRLRRRRRRWWSPTSTAPASGPSRASRAAWWPTPSGRRTRGCPSSTRRAGRSCARPSRAELAAGRPLPHPRRRRPHHAARRAARVTAVVTPSDDAASAVADAPAAHRATLMKPLGPLTTYGVGGPAALFVEVEGPDDLEAVRRALRDAAGADGGRPLRRSSSSGGAPTCWWRTRASTGWWCISARASPAWSCRRPGGRRSSGARRRGRGPAARAGPAGAGPPGGRRRVVGSVVGRRRARLGRRRRAHERRWPRVGHGVVPRPLHLGRPVQRRRRHRRRQPPGLRLPLLVGDGRPQVVVAAELAVTPGSAEAEQAAVAAIVRWRREHQPGGSNAGSVFTNPEGDSAGTADRGGRVEGVPHRARRTCRRSTPTSSRRTRTAGRTTCARSWSTCARVVAERCGVDAAHRGPPPGLRRREDWSRVRDRRASERRTRRPDAGGAMTRGPVEEADAIGARRQPERARRARQRQRRRGVRDRRAEAAARRRSEPMDPRISARRTAVMREQGRRRLGWSPSASRARRASSACGSCSTRRCSRPARSR